MNPEIVATEGTRVYEEGCLSFPTAREEIERADKVRVKAQDRDGKWFGAGGRGPARHGNPA